MPTRPTPVPWGSPASAPTPWQTATATLETEVRAWRAAHPDATLTEIEAALDARLDRARVGLLAEIAMAEIATDEPVASMGASGPAAAGATVPRCSDCGGRLVQRGTRTRTLRTRGDVPLPLTRAYLSCPACGTGLSPPR